MASPGSYSEEGEIIETLEVSTKATAQNPTGITTNINAYPRAISASSSSKSSAHNGREYSRSPFRHVPRSPRGQKRRYEDDRRHEVRYEERSLKTYGDIDQNGATPYGGHARHNDDYYGRRHGGRGDHRSRRSPEPRSRTNGQSSRREWDNNYGRPGNKDRRDRAQGHFDRRPSWDYQAHGHRPPVASVARVDEAHRSQPIADTEPPASSTSTLDAPPAQPEVDYTEPVIEDEASLEAMRAEKRRKREEIRARAAASAQPLLKQALIGDVSTSEAATLPTASPAEQIASPTVDSPDVSMQDSFPNSPAAFEVGKDNRGETQGSPEDTGSGAEDIAAADYDPTKDMEDDRWKANLGHSDMPASAYNENNGEKRQVLLPTAETKQEPSAKKPKKELDMFASDDDFEEMLEEEHNTAHNVYGKELDQNLLDNWDDEEGFYKIIRGELIGGRYIVERHLGKGVFAEVVSAKDKETSEMVAIKIARKNDMMRTAGIKETKILQSLMNLDPDDKKHMVRFKAAFEHKRHYCMVFESLAMNLRDLLKIVSGGRGLSLDAVRQYARQIFRGLLLLKSDHVVHCDLKPDNILVSDDRKIVKICDLGTAVDERDPSDVTPYVVSRFYRAPEIILGSKVSYSTDMWSIGCTLYELWTGKVLFNGMTNNHMLKLMSECRGRFERKLLGKFSYSYNHFDLENMKFCSIERDRINPMKTVARWIDQTKKPSRDLKTRVFEAAKDMKDPPSSKDLNDFADLLDRCLKLDPAKRVAPEEALKHEFIGLVAKPLQPVRKPAGPTVIRPTKAVRRN